MSNTNVRAAAEGMPADPILAAIQAYRDGNAAFCSIKEKDWPDHGGEEAVIEKTYGPPTEVLNEWDSPAVTREGVLEALRIAAFENDMSACVPIIAPMLSAALAYFESETTSEIESLYQQWLDCIANDATKLTAEEIAAMAEEELEANNIIYQDLQEKITAMPPKTAREMAISLLVEKDGGGSDTRPEYNERVQRLIHGNGWL